MFAPRANAMRCYCGVLFGACLLHLLAPPSCCHAQPYTAPASSQSQGQQPTTVSSSQHFTMSEHGMYHSQPNRGWPGSSGPFSLSAVADQQHTHTHHCWEAAALDCGCQPLHACLPCCICVWTITGGQQLTPVSPLPPAAFGHCRSRVL